jgi:hypothetical protein
MSTKSSIALEYADGTVESVYCHFDGYIDHNGKLLFQHWRDPFRLQQLIDQGDLSALGQELGQKHYIRNPYAWGTDDFVAWKNRYSNWCKFYGRDNQENDCQKKSFRDILQYLENQQWQDYNYILRLIDGVATWFVSIYSERKFVNLVDAFHDSNILNYDLD